MKENIFHSASLKLASLYLLIIFFISLLFSSWLFNVSMSEIRQTVLRVPAPVERIRNADPDFAAELRNAQDEAIEEARNSLMYQLIIINVIIAIAGATVSYYLARRSLKPIEEAHEAQSRFTADASHELRTPITAMRTETEITLTEPKLTLKDAKQQLESNIEELDKLTALSDGLLRLARLDNSPLIMERTNLNQIIHEATSRVSPLADQKHQHIIENLAETITLQADPTSLTDAVVVLLDNAIKYSPDEAEITIATKQQRQHVTLIVSDQGVGIPPKDLPHIFERFYRADQSRTKNKVNGYGIGLSIVKAIIEAHRGSVSVKSTVGQGTSFTVNLPL